MVAGPRLLEPLARLRKRLPDARCVVLGAEISPAQYDQLVAEARETGGTSDLSTFRWLDCHGLLELPAVLKFAGVRPGQALVHFVPTAAGVQAAEHRHLMGALQWLTPAVVEAFKQVGACTSQCSAAPAHWSLSHCACCPERLASLCARLWAEPDASISVWSCRERQLSG